MRILFICQEFPIPSYANTIPVLNSLPYLSGKFGHDITLAAFKLPGRDYPDLSPYCQAETVDIPVRPGLRSPRAFRHALKNVLRGRLSLTSLSYSPQMSRKVNALLANRSFDVLVVDHPSMLPYVARKGIPVVLLEVFEQAEIALMHYRLEKHWLKKIVRLLYYYQTKNYAKTYRLASISIAVSHHQREAVLSRCPELDIVVIPTGIDTDYFRATEPETEFPSLIITGSMGSPSNKAALLYFYREIYPLIKERVPPVKLYIVGSNPDKEILQLASDESVTVTGYVADLRPYLSRAWVVVAPLQESFGIKHRVQQAMTVGKPVVSTPMVTTGIDVSPGENMIIADEPGEFARSVIKLLNDQQMRERIGAGARQLMVASYGRESASERLNEVLERAARKKDRPKE